jgi:hypothetical protein
MPLALKPIPGGYVDESTQEISMKRMGSVIVSVKENSRINHDIYHDQSSGIPKRLPGEFNILQRNRRSLTHPSEYAIRSFV